MVSSYYNPLSYSQKHTAPNLTYPSAPHQPWFSTNYHPAAAANNQFLSSMDPQHHQPMYYNPHMFHQTAAAADLYAARENFQNLSAGGPLSVAHSQMFSSTLPHNQQQQQQHINNNNNNNGSHQNHQQNHHHHQQQQHAGHNSNGSTGGNSPLDETSSSADLLTDGIPSPPITNLSSAGGGGPGGGGGSEISSPGIPNASSSPQISINGQQPTPSSSPYRYEWMKKPAYASQPNPGKTRTKDKYRVVYTDFQRLELEKEYHTSRYITIRRKTELAQGLQLSERQVKIWFQNRRAKERKQTKKRDDSGSSINSSNGGGVSGCITGQNNGISSATADELVNFMEPKPPKLESGLHHHLSHQHSFHHHHHQMMATGMSSSMSGLQALHHHHGHLAAVAAAASGNSSSPVTLPSQHMQHVYQQMSGIETIS